MNRDHDAHPPTHSTDSHERGHSAASSQLLARAVTTAPGTPRRQRPPPPATGLSIELQLVRGIEPRHQCHWRDLLQRAPCSPLFSVATQHITVVVVLSPSPFSLCPMGLDHNGVHAHQMGGVKDGPHVSDTWCGHISPTCQPPLSSTLHPVHVDKGESSEVRSIVRMPGSWHSVASQAPQPRPHFSHSA
jgi:hypothetical protein